VVEAVWLRAHHDLEADDGEAVDVSTLGASRWREVLTQYLRRSPQLAYQTTATTTVTWPRMTSSETHCSRCVPGLQKP